MTKHGSGSDREAMLRWAGDESRLLPGEDPNSMDVDDALHWVQVYEELRRVKSHTIEEAERHLAAIPPEGQDEIEMDLELLRVQSRRLEMRREFWRRRGLELSGQD